ncbi:hypothetical protein, conserved [Trypanosoma brucei gambiense DAL972]|uniref:Uncharacterized protein n=1 Tax=Trypanosoma brucei gambiense (strain MHOM/CI/86/DAL972) TaxID=679716 RepID=D0A8R9_TRYB9|nr:hypothetical protein, conserved [Trypanosoma brucei gambiense DAL972]6SG9_FJ Chain FJ, mt-SAF18 [Trypanosoma brucei brucei]6SGA_FJ Chain FJ, mt-SAF18 [Trypanosoma brucei brucei]6SGB_FJ Chain FJ, mt-SAF18 [Trypanosoma brucei brucei]CBH18070.1 hypothetical protein, conserved [Trypanosoma brucei gambiense DAL972]|eukprot:XP_011780334.1 hypothetical protein, conserved [Trypanosoma brucei gambiense DAL972]
MLCHNRLLLVNKQTQKYRTKLRYRFRQPSVVPLRQTLQQRHNTILEVLRRRRINSGDQSPYRYVEERLYSKPSRLDREGVKVNKTYALQGLGDLEPLRYGANFGISEKDALKYETVAEKAKYMEPPIPYSSLAARKLAAGALWPAAPDPEGMISKEVRLLRHESSMSPSARAFSERVAYHLRRSLKACPGHIAEHIDFTQLIIQEVLGSRRSKEIYIVWFTVDPGARFELEPRLHQLNHWVQQLIIKRVKRRPHIPRVTWIYDGGRLERELPRDVKQELQSFVADAATTLESRVKYLKELDTMNQRMKDIPWFMPYLWSKEEKAARQKSMLADLEEVERRKNEHSSGRSAPPRTSPPPQFVR